MSITIKKRASWGGETIYASETATTIKEAIAEMRNALKDGEKLNLQGADLQDADLQDADLWGANLQGADLQDADLQGANLQDADLQDADLQDANLQGANLRGANLQDAYLQDADLWGADLRGANLQDAYLQDANLQDANLQDANLWGAYLQGASVGGGDAGIGLTPKSLGLPDAAPAFALSVIEAALSTPESLEMETWHTCETTHCLAGWAVHLSGVAGKALEATTSPSVAGAILAPSLAHLFYVSNEEALEALPKIKAELERAVSKPPFTPIE